jgi:hypothetical protein
MEAKRNPAPRAAGRASGMLSLAAIAPGDKPATGNIQGPDRRRDANAEARIQAAIVDWVRIVAPDALVFHIPNGGLRGKAEAARLKWVGTLAGVPDLAIVTPGGRVKFIEVKTADGTLSPSQRDVHGFLTALGTPPAIVRSIDDARRAFAAWGLETREALQ